MKIALIEPFFAGSHQSWAKAFQKYSQHEVTIFSLPGRHWKWRMHGGAVSLSQKFLDANIQPDLILATDMLDLSVFLSLTREKSKSIPSAIYFHENQISYPWSNTDPDVQLKRDNHYGFINFTSALAADAVFFNSLYHQNSFLQSLPLFLKQFPDHNLTDCISTIQQKSSVLHLGCSLKNLLPFKRSKRFDRPVILWNHRWEYDKNPDLFFETLFKIKDKGIPFYLVILGKAYQQTPPIFRIALQRLEDEIIHVGFTDSFEDYAHWLWVSDIYPVTNNQDFFGASVIEAIYCNNIPILPNRLAYPEHIPLHLHANYFYQRDEELFERLLNLLDNPASPKLDEECIVYLGNYDWSNLIKEYDEKLSNICKPF